MTTLSIKRGDTFLYTASLSDDAGPTNITGWTIASQVRDDNDALVATLNVTVTNAALGQFTVRHDDTSAWPARLVWDLQYTDAAGVVRSTETIVLSVMADVTRQP